MKIFICLLFAFSVCQAEKISMATWNIRTITKWDSLNGHYWKDRMPHIVSLIQTYDFDLLALQEVSERQLKILKEQLVDYSVISAGRDDGYLRGEAVCIFFKGRELKLLESGHFWLSATPDIPSVGWDGENRKICVWGRFLEESSKTEIRAFSVHLDHKGILAQENGIQQIIDSTDKKEEHVFVFGDFNAVKDSPVYKKFKDIGFWEAGELASQKYIPSGTYNMYTFDRKTEDILDLIFISKPLPITYYGVLNNFFWQEGMPKHISDHYPVLIRVDLPKTKR